jgi:hypothetical protein
VLLYIIVDSEMPRSQNGFGFYELSLNKKTMIVQLYDTFVESFKLGFEMQPLQGPQLCSCTV